MSKKLEIKLWIVLKYAFGFFVFPARNLVFKIDMNTAVYRYIQQINLRLHSKAGGGLNGAHSGFGQPSQDAGIWNEI